MDTNEQFKEEKPFRDKNHIKTAQPKQKLKWIIVTMRYYRVTSLPIA